MVNTFPDFEQDAFDEMLASGSFNENPSENKEEPEGDNQDDLNLTTIKILKFSKP